MRLVIAGICIAMLSACSQTAPKKTSWSGPWVSPDTRTHVLFENLLEEQPDTEDEHEESDDDL